MTDYTEHDRRRAAREGLMHFRAYRLAQEALERAQASLRAQRDTQP